MSVLSLIGFCLVIVGVMSGGYWLGYQHGYESGESAEWWRHRLEPLESPIDIPGNGEGS